MQILRGTRENSSELSTLVSVMTHSGQRNKYNTTSVRESHLAMCLVPGYRSSITDVSTSIRESSVTEPGAPVPVTPPANCVFYSGG